MSGHNPPHGRLGQPNSTWNPLQVPSYIPRQPQLAHMSSERSMARSPLTWHTPPSHQDPLYNFMAANHKNNLEINPMLQTFGRTSGMPLGSVDLSLSSATRSTPSPKGNNLQSNASLGVQHGIPIPTNIPTGLGGPSLPDQNDHFHHKTAGHTQQQHHHNTNHNRSPSATQMGSVIQSTSALKDRPGLNPIGSAGSGNTSTTCTFLGNTGNNNMTASGAGGNGYYNMITNNNASGSNSSSCVGSSNSINRTASGLTGVTTPATTVGVSGEFPPIIPGGLHIKDAKQINMEADKSGRENMPVITEPSDLMKDILLHAMQGNSISVSPKQSSPLHATVSLEASPTRTHTPPTSSMLLHPMDEPSMASVNKSFSMISANVPSTPNILGASDSKVSTPATVTSPVAPLTSVTDVSGRTSPNQSITSNEDSVDSNSSKSRRKRKPERTSKMASEEIERMHDFLGGGNSADKSDRIDGVDPMRPNIAVRSDLATMAFEGLNSLSQGLASDNSHSPHITDLSDSTRINLHSLEGTNIINKEVDKSPPVNSVIAEVLSGTVAPVEPSRKNSESNSDDCETIDKIAAMISSTQSENASTHSSLPLPTDTSLTMSSSESGTCNGPAKDVPVLTESSLTPSVEKGVFHKNDTDKSYEEIENKLEEMFAGIEETLPTCSKTTILADKPLSKQSNEPTDILTELSEKTGEFTPSSSAPPTGTSPEDSPEPSTSGTQKRSQASATKRVSPGKSLAGSSNLPGKRKKILKRKVVQTKGASFAAAEEKASTFLMKPGKKSLPKANGKKGNGSGHNAVKNLKVRACESGSHTVDPNNKYKGPYVQVKSDGSHVVINAPINEDDFDKPQNKTKKFSNSMNNSEKSKIRGLHVSTLSTKYDADTTDTSWMCVFCKIGPHKMRLGDLFGPYIITTKTCDFDKNQAEDNLFNVKRTRDSLASKLTAKVEPASLEQTPKSKKRKCGESASPSTSAIQQKTDSKNSATVEPFFGMIKAGDDSFEVWMHEDCLVWAPGVYIIGTRIVGLESAIWNCCRHQCRICLQYGATVSCLQRGCGEEAHIICARKNSWELDTEFKARCNQHSKTNS